MKLQLSVLTNKVFLRKDLKKVEERVWLSEQTGTAGAKTVKQEAAWHILAAVRRLEGLGWREGGQRWGG